MKQADFEKKKSRKTKEAASGVVTANRFDLDIQAIQCDPLNCSQTFGTSVCGLKLLKIFAWANFCFLTNGATRLRVGGVEVLFISQLVF